MFYYLISILAAIGTAGNFAATKVYQKHMGNGVRSGIIFNIFIGLFSSILFFAISGFKWECTLFSLIIALLFTIFVGIYTIIGFKIMSMGSMTVYTVFLMLGGAVVPYLYGILFLNETINAQKVLALLFVACAVLLNLFDIKEKKQSLKFILLCFAVFLLNGGTSVVSKLHQIETNYATVSASAFVMLKSLIRFVFFAVLLVFFREKNNTQEQAKLNVKVYTVMILSALISGVAYYLQLISAAHMPATVLYPMVTGGTIIFSSIFDSICFKQHLSTKTLISIFICLLSLILFVI